MLRHSSRLFQSLIQVRLPLLSSAGWNGHVLFSNELGLEFVDLLLKNAFFDFGFGVGPPQLFSVLASVLLSVFFQQILVFSGPLLQILPVIGPHEVLDFVGDGLV